MADDEQFSLCWNNFNSNLSAGFHESLCRGDLVDVTLAAEGQFVKAHRLVLSVCSPYFRKMFTQMPANQHAFVFLKDVSHSALKDLIQFMYCGEVNVKQEALPAFISTAEALQIKGLTDSDPAPAQSPAKPSTPAPQPAPPAQTINQALTPPRVRQRNSTSRSYRIETDDSDDKTTQIVLQTTSVPQQQTQPTIVQQTSTTTAIVSQKRTAPRSISTPHTKRVKNADPLEASEPTQITVQTVTESNKSTSEAEFIDLPIEMPTKSEPDYTEETGEVETAEQEATYVEDDSYGDMKYDDSYFTEQEETGAATGNGGAATTSTAVVKQSFVDNSYVEQADQSANEAQGIRPELVDLVQRTQLSSLATTSRTIFTYNRRGQLVYDGYKFSSHAKNPDACMILRRCSFYPKTRCPATIQTKGKNVVIIKGEHNHKKPTNEKAFVPIQWNEVLLSSCLKLNLESLIILKKYEKTHTLEETDRIKIAKIIINNILLDDFDRLLKKKEYIHLSTVLCKIFPTEEKDTFYTPSIGKTKASGKLLCALMNARTALKSCGLIKRRSIASSSNKIEDKIIANHKCLVPWYLSKEGSRTLIKPILLPPRKETHQELPDLRTAVVPKQKSDSSNSMSPEKDNHSLKKRLCRKK